MRTVSAQFDDVVFVSLKAFDVQRKATVAKDSTAIVVRADGEQPFIACPGWLATEDGQWSTATVSTIKGEKVSFHRVASGALRATAADLDGTPIEWEKKPKAIDLQAALVELTGGELGTTDTEKPTRAAPSSSGKSWGK